MNKMGQREVYNFLEEQRKITDKWFTVTEIREELTKNGMSNGSLKNLNSNLLKLSVVNLIGCKGVGLWDHKKLFRAY